MLGVFSSSVVSPPEELVAAGSRTPSPKTKAAELLSRFLAGNTSAVSAQLGDYANLAFSHVGESPIRPRYIYFFSLNAVHNKSIHLLCFYQF